MTIKHLGPAWFGKIPAAGDFVSHRFPHALQLFWDQWIRTGLARMQEERPDEWRGRFARGPIWNFVIPPSSAIDMVQIGIFSPSVDRVGRLYPLCISQMAPANALPQIDTARLGDFLAALGEVLGAVFRQRLGPGDVDCRIASVASPFAAATGGDEIMSILGRDTCAPGAAARTELPRFDLERSLRAGMDFSLWWTSSLARHPYQEIAHRGELSPDLFCQLYHDVFQPRPTFTS